MGDVEALGDLPQKAGSPFCVMPAGILIKQLRKQGLPGAWKFVYGAPRKGSGILARSMASEGMWAQDLVLDGRARRIFADPFKRV